MSSPFGMDKLHILMIELCVFTVKSHPEALFLEPIALAERALNRAARQETTSPLKFLAHKSIVRQDRIIFCKLIGRGCGARYSVSETNARNRGLEEGNAGAAIAVSRLLDGIHFGRDGSFSWGITATECPRSLRDCFLGNGEWNGDFERRPGLRSRIQKDFATVVFDDPLRDGKAQARALGFAAGEKGLEYEVPYLRGNSRPVIPHVNSQAGLSSQRGDRRPGPTREKLPRRHSGRRSISLVPEAAGYTSQWPNPRGDA